MNIYFIQCEHGGPIKIGKTKGYVGFRVEDLQLGCPYILIILGVIEDDSYTEKEIHDKFSKCRLHGEWFEPTPEIFDFIDNHTKKFEPKPIRRSQSVNRITGEVSERKNIRWLHDEVEYLKENYDSCSITQIAQALGKNKNAVISKAYQLGLRKAQKTKYKYVYYSHQHKKWRGMVYEKGTIRHIGLFDTDKEAHEAVLEYKHNNQSNES